jgi:hypothetical protein
MKDTVPGTVGGRSVMTFGHARAPSKLLRLGALVGYRPRLLRPYGGTRSLLPCFAHALLGHALLGHALPVGTYSIRPRFISRDVARDPTANPTHTHPRRREGILNFGKTLSPHILHSPHPNPIYYSYPHPHHPTHILSTSFAVETFTC